MPESFYQPDNFRPQNSIGYLIRRIHKLGLSRVEADFADLEITFTQWAVLALLHSGIADTCGGLARNLGHNSGAMTRVLDQLEERALLRRAQDPEDRRVTKLRVTDEGRAMIAALGPRVMGIWNEYLEGFDRQEVLVLIDLLTRLLGRLEHLEGNCGGQRP
ncbi:MAG: MarR family transcriptional regulator [Novosphingobium sp.]|jgi:DNA-binding MarR family transcriptional regulator|uniref:MarR family winged helix-turn-helix transcriptional regulator n=1 Tax=Tsuneonella sp. CC-YZS046 TaxID=3042152 RepID=UPI002D770ED6|nr:MarR family transcriptional regulator [Tsuneonella sp. CC-YZS046]WRO66838.1 MarR family transcriptional regulator [Tsuneonella sp. CC-YZS046]